MKKLQVIISFIFSLSLAAQPFGDDNPSGKWLPTPDDFSWQQPLKSIPEFETTSKSIAEIPAGLAKAMEAYTFAGKKLEQITAAQIDLNSDGRPEWFVNVPEYDGSGGPFYAVFTSLDGKRYLRICVVQGWGFKFHKPKNGWLEFEGMSRGGGGNYTRFMMTFQYHQYRGSRFEHHDFNSKEVNVSFPEPEQLDWHDSVMKPIKEYKHISAVMVDAFIALPEEWFESGRPHWIRDHNVASPPFVVFDPRNRTVELLGDGAQESVDLKVLDWSYGEDRLKVNACGMILIRTEKGWRKARLEEK